MNPDSKTDEIINALSRGQVVVVTGTGVSIGASNEQKVDGFIVSQWEGLLFHGVEYCFKEDIINQAVRKSLLENIRTKDVDLLISVAETITRRMENLSPGIYRRWLNCSIGKLQPKNKTVIEILSKWSALQATLNYDNLFEAVTGWNAVTWRERDKVDHIIRGERKNCCIHLHGYFEDPESIVFGWRTYSDVMKDPHAGIILRMLTIARTIVFIGCESTFIDPNFTEFINSSKEILKDSTVRHYILCRKQDKPNFADICKNAPWLTTVVYGENYQDLAPFLEKISPQPDTGTEMATDKEIIEELDLVRYMHALRERYTKIKLESLDAMAFAFQDLDLLKMFIPQHVRECQEYLPQVLEYPRDQTFGPEEADTIIQNILRDERDERELWNLRRRYLEQSPQTVMDLVEDAKFNRLVILGDPGSGKSSLVQTIALTKGERNIAIGRLEKLPIIFELRAYAQEREKGVCANLLEYYEKSELAPFQIKEKTLRNLLLMEETTVLFDGLDEVYDPDRRSEVVNSIMRFGDDFPNAKIIITSRLIGYKGDAFRNAGYRHFMIQELNNEQIELFLDRWHEIMYRSRTGIEGNEKKEKLRKIINESRPIRELAGNPLLLTMMALVNRHRDLPKERSELYEECSKLLLEQWNLHKASNADSILQTYASPIGLKERQQILKNLAYEMQSGSHGNLSNLITADKLEELIERTIRPYVQVSSLLVARELINQLRMRNFILCYAGGDSFAFVHRSFLEYFCAEYIREKFEHDKSISEEELQGEIFGLHWMDESWHEVLSLVAGMLHPAIMGKMFDYLIRIEDESGVFKNIFLAARCLGEIRNRHDLDPGIEEKIHAVLESLAAYELTYYYERFSKEEEIVKSIRQKAVALRSSIRREGDDSLTWLFMRAIQDPHFEVRQTALQEILHGGRRTKAELDLVMDRLNNDESTEVKITALRELARRWKNSLEIMDLVVQRATGDINPEVRKAALQELGQGWYNIPDVVGLIRKQAEIDPSNEVKRTAIHEYSRIREAADETKEWLINLARNGKHRVVRTAAIAELSSRYANDEDQFAVLRDILHEQPDEEIVRSCIEAISQYWRGSQETYALLVKFAIEAHDWTTRRLCIQELAQGWKNDPATRERIKGFATDDINFGVCKAAIHELAYRWRDDRETLDWLKEHALQDNDSFIRQTAIAELSIYWQDNEELYKLLIDRVRNDRSGVVRKCALQELIKGWRNTPEVYALVKQVAAENREVPDLRKIAIEELARNWKREDSTFSLLKFLARRDLQWEVIITALREMVRGWKKDEKVRRILLRHAQNRESWQVRKTALQELAWGWRDDREVKKMLMEHANTDPQNEVKEAAIIALARGWPDDPDTFVLLNSVIQQQVDPQWDTIRAAVREISRGWKNKIDMQQWLLACSKENENWAARQAALQELARDWRDRDGILDHIKGRARDDKFWMVQRTAIREVALYWHNHSGTLRWIKEFAKNDTDWECQLQAVEELSYGWNSDPEVVGMMKHLAKYSSNNDVRIFAIQQLKVNWREEPDSKAILLDKAVNDSIGKVRMAAISALSEGWGGDPEVVNCLSEIAQKDAVEDVMLFAEKELGQITRRARGS